MSGAGMGALQGYQMGTIWGQAGSGAAGAVEAVGTAGKVEGVTPARTVEGTTGAEQEQARVRLPGQTADSEKAASLERTGRTEKAGRIDRTAGTAGTEKTKETKKAECQTCKERKYMDRSNEGDVSFQSPTHIAPGQAAARVMSHEREHVQNAVSEGQKENKRLVSVSVSLKTAVCPECGRTYIAGGTTRTKMLTYRDNPYDQGRKSVEGTVLRGMNVDQRV